MVAQVAYCTDDEVFSLGLSAQAFVVRARPVTSGDVDIATGTIRLKAHGLSPLDAITFEVTSGGSLPTGISAFVVYAPEVVSADLFRVQGFASFASAGSGWAVAVDPLRRIRMHAEDVSARIDECLTADEPPIKVDPLTGKFPAVLRGLAARMTARAAINSLQVDNPAYRTSIDRLMAQSAFDGDTDPPAQVGSLLGDWKRGKPINPRPIDQTSTAENSARAGSSRDASDWTTGAL